MDLGLTEAQEILKTSVADFVQREYDKNTLLALERSPTGITPELLRKVAALGWLGVVIPEAYGGEGRSLTDAAVLFEELGRGPVPGPFFASAVLGALTVEHGGTESQKQATAQFDELDAILKKQKLDWADKKAKPIIDGYHAQHPRKLATVEQVADHIDHVKKLAGIDHVGLGSDFDGVGDTLPKGLRDVSEYPNLIRVLLERGYTDDEIEKLCSGNSLRVWQAVEDFAKSE